MLLQWRGKAEWCNRSDTLIFHSIKRFLVCFGHYFIRMISSLEQKVKQRLARNIVKLIKLCKANRLGNLLRCFSRMILMSNTFV